MERSDAASGCTVIARVTTPAQARTALERGAAGVLTSIDDVLATTGQLGNVLEAAVRRGSGDGALTEIHEAVAEAFAPLLAALDGADIDVRAIDVRSDEAGELVPQALLDDASQLLLPIGDPDVLRAEMGGSPSRLSGAATARRRDWWCVTSATRSRPEPSAGWVRNSPKGDASRSAATSRVPEP